MKNIMDAHEWNELSDTIKKWSLEKEIPDVAMLAFFGSTISASFARSGMPKETLEDFLETMKISYEIHVERMKEEEK